jgi:adenylylsulfate kinase-like enzyme
LEWGEREEMVCLDWEKEKPEYRHARSGEIQLFTGLSDAYEPPTVPDVECRTDRESIGESVAKVLTLINERLNL